MKNNFQNILAFFLEPYAQTQSQRFLEKFWLSDKEISNDWEAVKNTIFSKDFKRLPDILYDKDFEMIAQRGGTLFIENEYLLLQECMKIAGDNFFVLIENLSEQTALFSVTSTVAQLPVSSGDIHHTGYNIT